MKPTFCEALTTSGCAAAGNTLGSLQAGSGYHGEKGAASDQLATYLSVGLALVVAGPPRFAVST